MVALDCLENAPLGRSSKVVDQNQTVAGANSKPEPSRAATRVRNVRHSRRAASGCLDENP